MLVAADETLLHQTGRPFSQTDHSDHRFYDRHWFTGIHPDGDLAFNLGMGLYKNLNVMDGFFAVMKGNRQHNLRLSRVLRPNIEECRVGPLSIEIIEPFRHIRLSVGENEHGIACMLDWKSEHAVHLEARHTDAVGEAITQANTRYDQVASVSGWISLAGQRHEVDRWWSVRDHSWGIRPGVGGFEPVRGDHAAGPNPMTSGQVRLWLWSCLSTPDYSLQMQRIEDAEGKVLVADGTLLYRPALNRPAARVQQFEHQIEFHPATHAVRELRYTVTLSDGQVLDIKGEPAVRAWAYSGTGYDRGYNDKRGLGAQRGNPAPEYDIYDLSDVEIVLDPDGKPISPGHREQPVRLTVNGTPCIGHFPVMVFDTLPGLS